MSCLWVGATPAINTGWGDEGTESSPAEKDLGVLVDALPVLHQSCVWTAREEEMWAHASREFYPVCSQFIPWWFCSREPTRTLLRPMWKSVTGPGRVPSQGRGGLCGRGALCQAPAVCSDGLMCPSSCWEEAPLGGKAKGEPNLAPAGPGHSCAELCGG